MSRPTIKDIARACDVSLSTVSLVLNKNPRISEATRQKVLAVVEQSGYQPNAFARSLASRSSHAVSVVVPHLNHVFADAYFGEIVSGIYDSAADLGFKILLDIADRRFLASREYMRLVKSRRVDGMLFIGSSVHDAFLLEFEKTPAELMLVNHYIPGSGLHHIMVDYPATARLAAQHLTGLGHRRIGLLVATNTYTALDFMNNFIAACGEFGILPGAVPWADGWFTELGGYEAARWLFERHPDLTAIMAGNDKMAMGALRYLREIGRNVPGDVSVMGVDDLPVSTYASPALTTIRHDLYKVGRMALENLVAATRMEAMPHPGVLPVRLVARESTGPARN